MKSSIPHSKTNCRIYTIPVVANLIGYGYTELSEPSYVNISRFFSGERYEQ